MRRFSCLFLVMLLFLAHPLSSALAASLSPVGNADPRSLGVADPAALIQFGGSDQASRFEVTGFAGEVLLIDISEAHFPDACAVELQLIDAADRTLFSDTCAGRDGRLGSITLPTEGSYHLILIPHEAAIGTLKLKLGSPNPSPQAATPAACQISTLALDTVVPGSWDASCASVYFSGGQHYAQYYTITVPSQEVVTITLSSTGTATDAFAVLRNGADFSGSVIQADDNDGPGNNAQIIANLPAGTYTIEATTYNTYASGGFTLVARTNTAPCFSTVKLNRVKNSSWTTDCSSVYFSGGDHYAKYFTLSIPTEEEVSITLTSSGTATDAFVVLRNGTTQLGSVLSANDNSGPGNNAEVVLTLPAGDYTIEATTYNTGAVGDFSLAVRTNQRPCFGKLSLNTTLSSKWTTSCTSTYFSGGDHYAKYYTISVPTQQIITITLTSTTTATDSFLVLRSGDSQVGTIVTADDNNGPGNNAQIVVNLPSGTYTIEATTYNAAALGTFDLVARTNTSPCFAPLDLDTPVTDNWTTDCTSVYFSGGEHYAKYYTITVPADEIITITLSSTGTATDAFAILRNGNTQLGSIVRADDNNGPGNNAQIVVDLPPGTYTIETTTYNAGAIGGFNLVARTNTTPCFSTLPLNAPIPDTWTTDCTSVYFSGGDHYAKYYTLSVPVQANVTIALNSSSLATDAFLVLRNGDTQLGSTITADDNSGGSGNAKIIRSLPPGIYTIEATTYGAYQLGDFTLSASD